MKRALMIMVLFMFTLPAMAEKVPYTDPDLDSYTESQEYRCSVNSVVSKSRDFRSRQSALDWCKPFGKFCVARRGRYQGWQGFFQRSNNFEFSSKKGWSDSRVGSFALYHQYIDDNKFYTKGFRHSFQFDGCYSEY